MAIDVNVQKTLGNFFLDLLSPPPAALSGSLGASGCGKSKTPQCIAGIETPTGDLSAWTVRFSSTAKKIDACAGAALAGYLFQDYALFPNMTVEENIFHSIRENCNKAEKGKSSAPW